MQDLRLSHLDECLSLRVPWSLDGQMSLQLQQVFEVNSALRLTKECGLCVLLIVSIENSSFLALGRFIFCDYYELDVAVKN